MMTLCVSLTMWAFADGTVEWSDENRPETPEYDNVSGLYYYLNEEGEAVITYQVDSEANYAALETDDYTLPSTVGGYNVTSVGPWAFYHAPFTGKLTIPGSLLYINECSFAYCATLEEVEFEYDAVALADLNAVPYNNAFIGSDAVTTIVLRRDVTVSTSSKVVAPFAYVEGYETVYIGEYVTSIPPYMFRSNKGYKLSTVISDAPEPPALGASAFDHMASGLGGETTFYTKADYLNAYKANSDWKNAFGSDYMHAYDGPDPEPEKDENAFLYNGLWYTPNFDDAGAEDGTCSITTCQDGVYEGEIAIVAQATNEETGVTYDVTRIGESAFAESNIEGHVVIPGTILYLGQDCFASCLGITDVTVEYSPVVLFEENTHNMTDQSFTGCSNLINVYLNRDFDGYSSGSVQAGAFNGMTSIQHVFIGHMVTYIPAYMFRNTQTYPSLVDAICYSSEPPAIGASPFGAKSPANYDPDPILYAYDEYWEIYCDSDLYQSGGDWLRCDAIEDSDYDDMPYPFSDDAPTGISIISADSKSAKVSGIYNVAGQRVNENAKGLLIKDGKKVLVK